MITSGKKVIIYTDGACSGNPGPGGWGAVLLYGEKEKELSGFEAETTNNRMEMMAAMKALEALKHPCHVILHTDSRYLMDGFTKWLPGWKKNNWKTADKKPVKNQDLWMQLDRLVQVHKVSWQWVKGHSQVELNERADQLARQAIKDNQ